MKYLRLSTTTLSIGILFVLFSFDIIAQSSQTAFSISPPPLGYPDYEKYNADVSDDAEGYTPVEIEALRANDYIFSKKKVDLLYVSMKHEYFDMTLLGAAITLDAIKKENGYRVNASVLQGSGNGKGEASGISADLMATSAGIYYTHGKKQDKITPIIFGGPITTSTQIVASGETDDGVGGEAVISVATYGLSGGFQVLIENASFIFSPSFIYTQIMGGEATIYAENDDGEVLEESIDIEQVSSTSISIDILFKEKGITLSGMVQAAKNNDDEDIDVTMIGFGYLF
jgi:hypothetical protein